MKKYPVVGVLKPYWAACLMGVGIKKFRRADFHGLVMVDGDHIMFLAILSYHPGSGRFGAFLAELQHAYGCVEFLEVWNACLKNRLKREGFYEAGGNLIWVKPAPAATQP
jgi:hypothetical protein